MDQRNPTPLDKPRVLVVDDEPQNLQLLNRILEADHSLIFAKSGHQALERCRQQQPDLILLDVMMPDLDGHEVCRQLKADPRCNAIPVIFVTAMVSEDEEAAGFDLGAVDYIHKPIRVSVVRRRVATHLALRRQQQVCEERVQERTRDLSESRLTTLQMLGRAAEYRDNETGFHILRMSHYAQILAQAHGWNAEALDLVLNAAPMHDIGKIGIPDPILMKPARLNAEEWAVMREHPVIGATIIGEQGNQSELFSLAREIALHHHEKWNGQGYPAGRQGNDIPLSARIVAIADVFDALTSVRPYKQAWPLAQAVDLIRSEAGQHFDPELVALFLERMDPIQAIMVRWREASAPQVPPGKALTIEVR
ncbi:MAG: response regulator [Magnetococcus sp. WYHC-3]